VEETANLTLRELADIFLRRIWISRIVLRTDCDGCAMLPRMEDQSANSPRPDSRAATAGFPPKEAWELADESLREMSQGVLQCCLNRRIPSPKPIPHN